MKSTKKTKKAEHDLTLIVKEKHVKTGKRCQGDSCVLALAFREAMPAGAFEDVHIGRLKTFVELTDGTVLEYRTPKELRKQLAEWDNGAEWTAPPGIYSFSPPSQPRRTPEQIAKQREYDRQRSALRKAKKLAGEWPHDFASKTRRFRYRPENLNSRPEIASNSKSPQDDPRVA